MPHILSLPADDPDDGYPYEVSKFFIQRLSEEEDILARKIIVIFEIYSCDGHSGHLGNYTFDGLKMYGRLRQIRDAEDLKWL